MKNLRTEKFWLKCGLSWPTSSFLVQIFKLKATSQRSLREGAKLARAKRWIFLIVSSSCFLKLLNSRGGRAAFLYLIWIQLKDLLYPVYCAALFQGFVPVAASSKHAKQRKWWCGKGKARVNFNKRPGKLQTTHALPTLWKWRHQVSLKANKNSSITAFAPDRAEQSASKLINQIWKRLMVDS